MFGNRKKPESLQEFKKRQNEPLFSVYEEWLYIYLQHWSKDSWFGFPVTCLHCYALVEPKFQPKHLETHGITGSEMWYGKIEKSRKEEK